MKYDFAGWATKNDLTCSDGLVIRNGAFQHNDGKRVPLVWQHNSHEIKNILGSVELKHADEGVYAYANFNDSEEADVARGLLKHGDITHLSIGANKIKRTGANVTHGDIYEVSLVLAGANPGALIETVITHSDDQESKAILYTDELLHTDAEIKTFEYAEEQEVIEHKEKTVGDVMASLTPEQKDMVAFVIGSAVKNSGGSDMKHNIFNGNDEGMETLNHSEILADAQIAGSLQASMIEHGITNIEVLFPDAHALNAAPVVYDHNLLAAQEIMAGVNKSPFARIKTSWADLTPETARARGYVRGNEKFEQVYGVLTRVTTPTTVYVKQSLERDDILDITDFDVVAFANRQLRVKLDQEIARAIILGDGRAVNSPDKIKAENIRPIIGDEETYTMNTTYATANDLFEVITMALIDYRGSGTPTMYCHPKLLADLKLLRDANDRFLFGDIPSAESIATRLGLRKIVELSYLAPGEAVLVNLRDYTVGSAKGGQVTSFDDFDIDFNKYKYLIETRLCGALTLPKSAIHLTVAPARTATKA